MTTSAQHFGNPFESEDAVSFRNVGGPKDAQAPLGLDLRTIFEKSDPGSTFNSNFDLDELSAPLPFTTSRPKIEVQDDAGRSASSAIDFSKAQRTSNGRLCVVKESTVETLKKNPILECVHKNIQKCHYTYATEFDSGQEEVCEDNFEKLCQITFRKKAIRETVKKCYRPQRKVCNGKGPRECRTVYETSCTTSYIQKQPGKHYSPIGIPLY